MRRSVLRALRLAVLCLVGFAFCVACQRSPSPQPTPVGQDVSAAQQQVFAVGVGASSVAPLMNLVTNTSAPNILYLSQGSGAGVQAILKGSTTVEQGSVPVSFSFSDVPISDGDIQSVISPNLSEEIVRLRMGSIIQMPIALSPIDVVYNLGDVTGLKLSNQALRGIFEGEITDWSDSRITSTNPTLKLSGPISVVVRQDASGTSYSFVEYLETLGSRMVLGKNPRWPDAFIRAIGNEGVAVKVSQTSGSISYLSHSQALVSQLPTVALEARGGFVEANEEAFIRAAKSWKFDSQFVPITPFPQDGYPLITPITLAASVSLQCESTFGGVSFNGKLAAQTTADMVKSILDDDGTVRSQGLIPVDRSLVAQIQQALNEDFVGGRCGNSN